MDNPTKPPVAEPVQAEPSGDKSTSSEPVSYGDPIVSGDSPQVPDGAPAIALTSEEQAAKGSPQEPIPTFLNSKWPMDSKLPEGMDKYDTPEKLINAHEDAQRKISSQGEQLATLRSDNKSLREGNQSEAMADVRARAEAEIAEGGLKQDTIAALAQSSGWEETTIAAFGRFMVEAADRFNNRASLVLGGDENLSRFMEELNSGKFSREQLKTWDGFATDGKTGWLSDVAPQLGFTVNQDAGQPVQVQESGGPPNEPTPGQNRLLQPQIQVGDTPKPAAPDIFKTRAEYYLAIQKADDHYHATSDSSMRDEVRDKMRRSDRRSWGDQVGG